MMLGFAKKTILSPLYFNLLTPIARFVGCVRAGNLYQLAAYHLRAERVRGIVDGGAFDGAHSLYLSKVFPQARIFSFEPAPNTFSKLCGNVSGNSRILPVALALADRVGEAKLNVNAFAATNSLLESATSDDAKEIFDGRGDTAETVSVRTTTLDQFAVEQPHFRCDFLKLDLQGYEVPALHGAEKVLAEQARAVICEIRLGTALYVGDSSFEEIDGILAKMGFALQCIGEISHHPRTRTSFEANALWLKK